MLDLSLILPVHNEEGLIKKVFIDVKKTLDDLNISYELILVENGSIDNSLGVLKEIAEKNKNTKVLITPKGYGGAVLKGLSKARGKYLCYMPSDGQIDLKVFPKLWSAIKKTKCDLVKVKRITRESMIRLIISYAFSLIMMSVFRISFLDINGSPRIFLRKKIKLLNLKYKDSFIDAEFAVKAHFLNWRIKEIPMKTLLRLSGESTRNWKTFIEFFYNIYSFKTGKYLSSWQKSIKVSI